MVLSSRLIIVGTRCLLFIFVDCSEVTLATPLLVNERNSRQNSLAADKSPRIKHEIALTIRLRDRYPVLPC